MHGEQASKAWYESRQGGNFSCGPRRPQGRGTGSSSSSAAQSLVNRLVRRVGKTGQVRTDPTFEDARGPNVRELRCVQRRLSPPEIASLIAAYEAGSRRDELAEADAAASGLDTAELEGTDGRTFGEIVSDQPRALRRDLDRLLTVASNVDSCSTGKNI